MKKNSRVVLADVAYDYIKEMILKKKINCGDHINEQLIEEELNISRTPIREAIRRLAAEGILTLIPNCYAEVISFTKESIRDLGIVRITMDCLSAQLAIQNGSNNDFNKMKEISVRCATAHQEGDWFDQIKYDCEFHLKLIEISNNDLLLHIQKNLMLKTRLLHTSLVDEKSSNLSFCDINKHEAILDALFERDTVKVIDAVRQHLAPFYLLDDQEVNVVTLSPYSGSV